MKSYGKELILDLYDCDPTQNTIEKLELYIIGACDILNMERARHLDGTPMFYAWSEHASGLPDHLVGVSCVQFIRTSNILIHTLDRLRTVYINMFSCKEFESGPITSFTMAFFDGKIHNKLMLERG